MHGADDPEPAPAPEEKKAVEPLVETVFKELERSNEETIWPHVTRLVRMAKQYGQKVTDRLMEGVKHEKESVRLGCGRALCQLNYVGEATPALLDLVRKGSSPAVRQVAANAVGLAPVLAEDQGTVDALNEALKDEQDPQTRVAIARTLWRVGGRAEGRNVLVNMMRTHPEKAMRDEATLALAEMGWLRPKESWLGRADEAVCRDVFVQVVTLALEPTERGQRAFGLYRHMEESAARGADGGLRQGEQLLREIVAYIRRAYPDQEHRLGELDEKLRERLKDDGPLPPDLRQAILDKGGHLAQAATLTRDEPGEWHVTDDDLNMYIVREEDKKLALYDRKTNLEKLFENAGKGMLDSLDPFSQYLDRREVQSTQEMLRQDYGGIGAFVGVQNRIFTVISPIYNSPADQAGLRSMDSILEVDGEKTNELMENGGMNSVISKLKGPPGTPVKVKFYRRGFQKAMEVTIIRDTIKVTSVYHTRLEGDIGYIRLTRFGERSTDELDEALEDLAKQKPLKGLIFDLRNNPGGLLRTGVEVADRFLAANKLIVYSEGLKEFAPRKNFFSTGGGEDEKLPMVTLVNNGSASASEIVAGALRDHKRSVLIGEKTYGKGSVQQIIPLRATGNQTQLRLTIAKYYLPGGTCIHETGIEPDIKCEPEDVDDWAYRKIVELRAKHLFDDYARDRWLEHKALFLRLAEDDGGDASRYPDFAKLRKEVDPRVEDQDLRAELRRILRRMAQDELKHEYACDVQSDRVLQRGVYELLKILEIDPKAIAQYKDLPEKFEKKENIAAEQGAMLPAELK